MKKTSFFVSALFFSQVAQAILPKWSYDPGPDPKTKMGKELIDLTAEMPNMPEISLNIMGEQKFRPAFGPVTWRMLQKPNSVKILFIGQDATHIAEAAGRPATAGFGGRAQDLAAYFGVNEGAAFINTFAYTIKGQYGAFETPFVLKSAAGPELKLSNFVDNELWLLSQDVDSPLVNWRNNLIDWIIRNNKESLKLIVTFGGAARDSIASFIVAKGAEVGASRARLIENVQIAETRLEYAGGNNEYPILVNREGKDLYSQKLGKEMDYSKLEDVAQAKDDLKNNFASYLPEMVFTKGGPTQNGLLNPAQLGGYDLNQITLIKNKKTRSLRGLTLNDGTRLGSDVLVVELPHPTFLSNMDNAEASRAVGEDLKVLAPYVAAGWEINPDAGMENHFALGEAYKYARADIGPEYYDFGTPGSRMVPVSTASRMGGNPHVIIFGTREKAKFPMDKVLELTKAQPNEAMDERELFVTRPRSMDLRYDFDAGPGEEFAFLMKSKLNMKKIFKLKEGKTFAKDGINAFYVKTHPDIGDFGHYRGTFNNPRVIVLADPAGYDDLLTARALTGERGQYLQGLMNDMKVNDQYLVLKTVPFGMEEASAEDWEYVLKQTRMYRKNVLKKLLTDGSPLLILADGEQAQKEIMRLMTPEMIFNRNIAVVNMGRSGNHAEDMLGAAVHIKNLNAFRQLKARGERDNIPRSHLSFYARTWEGTSGDRVLNSTDKFKGQAFAIVAPEWAFKQKDKNFNTKDGTDILIKKLKKNNLPLPGEAIPAYLQRTEINPDFSFLNGMTDFSKTVA